MKSPLSLMMSFKKSGEIARFPVLVPLAAALRLTEDILCPSFVTLPLCRGITPWRWMRRAVRVLDDGT